MDTPVVLCQIVHDSGRGAPLAKVVFLRPYKYKFREETFIATKVFFTLGQFIYVGKKASLNIGAPYLWVLCLKVPSFPTEEKVMTEYIG